MQIQANAVALAQSVLPLVLGVILGMAVAASVAILSADSGQRFDAPPRHAMSESPFPG